MRDVVCRVVWVFGLVLGVAGCGGSGGGTEGKSCSATPSPCPDNSTCTDTASGVSCACKAGFSQTGSTCQDIDECSNGSAHCGANATCRNTPGSFSCACNSGYSGDGTTCTDIDECATSTTCASGQTCTNTPGSYTCTTAVCSPPKTVCGPLCVDTTSDQDHCGNCETACGGYRACVSSVCVGQGMLEISATWSRPGDADLIVRTPPGKLVWKSNRGPDATDTNYGEMDRVDSSGQGPENVYWDKIFTPPSGTYAICLATPSFSPSPSTSNPVNYTILVQYPSKASQTFTGSIKTTLATGACDSSQPSYVGSITYP